MKGKYLGNQSPDQRDNPKQSAISQADENYLGERERERKKRKGLKKNKQKTESAQKQQNATGWPLCIFSKHGLDLFSLQEPREADDPEGLHIPGPLARAKEGSDSLNIGKSGSLLELVCLNGLKKHLKPKDS